MEKSLANCEILSLLKRKKKKLNRLSIERRYLNIINAIYSNPTANIYSLKNWKLSLRSEIRHKCLSHHPYSIQELSYHYQLAAILPLFWFGWFLYHCAIALASTWILVLELNKGGEIDICVLFLTLGKAFNFLVNKC